jgi:hypothetical protein
MMGTSLLGRNVEHLEEESKILDVVGIVIIVDGEPEHGMGFRILVSNHSRSPSRGDKDGRRENTSSLRRDQSQIIVTLSVSGFQFIQIFNTVQTKLLQILLDIIGDKVGNARLFCLTVLFSWNQVISLLSEELSNTETNTGLVKEVCQTGCKSLPLFRITGESSHENRALQAPADDACGTMFIKRRESLAKPIINAAFDVAIITLSQNSTTSIR